MGMTQIEEFKKNLEELKPKLEKILKSDTDKFIQIAANYVEQNDGLLDKDRASLYAEIMKAAQAGLYVDGQESALVPFAGKIKLMVMYKGLLKQVRNSGELASINCGVVYENDVFEFSVDENGEHIKHVPNYRGDRGKQISTYAIARTKDSSAPYIEIMQESV
jgi:recombination protein RecT